MPENSYSIKVHSAHKPDLLVDAKSEVPDELYGLLQEAWQRADLSTAYGHQNYLCVVVNMGRIIGQARIVNAPIVALHEEALFSRKRYRRYVSRVIKIKSLPDSRYLSLTCYRVEQDWCLRRAEIGAFIAPEPMDFTTILRQGRVLPPVVHYWTRHAHIYRPETFYTAVQPNTWARVLSKAQLNHLPEVLEQVGYFNFASAHNIEIDLPQRRD